MSWEPDYLDRVLTWLLYVLGATAFMLSLALLLFAIAVVVGVSS